MLACADRVVLGRIALFKGLSDAQLAVVSHSLRRTSAPAGATVMRMEQHGDVAYIIESGTVKVCVDEAGGAEIILALLGAGEIVGELSLLGPHTRSASVVTLEACMLLTLTRTVFESWMDTMPPLQRNLTGLLARRLRLANAQIQALGTLDITGRVARQILAFADEYGQPDADGGTVIPLRLTQADLGALVGATRVRVNGAMMAFKRQGAIAVDGSGRITVRDAAVLARRCC